ncbi:hypothetical protein DFH27DRAFT_616544 [Peziza echinospora]|nr:hypothetical protein DFH27DRAFT_616544 [Peziza echinospora]
MSFGYGVGDLIAVGKLALDIYEKFKYIQRDASKDFKDLMAEVSLLNANVVTLDKAIKEPESTLISGDIRKEMLDEMVQRMVQTLKELEAIAGKYDKQLSKQAAQGQALKKSRKEWWALFRWSLDASEVNALRGKFMYYNGIMTLLFASAANSSIQQVVAAQKRIESIVKQIETHVEAFSTSQIPGVTNPSPVINHSRYSVLKNPIINATLFQNAEVVDQWTGISIGQWIHAGRWWLLKSQSRNRVATSTQNYVDLIKAAWIFIVLIKAHPQFNSIQPELLVEVEVLGEAITQKFDALEKKSFIAPEISVVRAADLRIWEVDKRDASVQPLDSGNDHSAWGTKEHFVLAQQ